MKTAYVDDEKQIFSFTRSGSEHKPPLFVAFNLSNKAQTITLDAVYDGYTLQFGEAIVEKTTDGTTVTLPALRFGIFDKT